MDSTYFALLAEFNTADIPLAQMCDKYFGISPRKASDKARLQQLPIPTYRCGSQKSTWLINAFELANYIDQQREKAKSDWHKMNA